MKPVVVMGATGYVGGRLVPLLLERGYSVIACGRSLEKIRSRSWSLHPELQIRYADVSDASSLVAALRGSSVLFYLVHSMMSASGAFEEADRKGAMNVVKAAEAAGVERVIYLGGLGEDQENLSHHLRSRREVAQILKMGRVPVTVLRAAMIIGAGSASFEILRYLVDRLPVMITPKWVSTPNQPIGIRNVLEYLIGCLDKPETMSNDFDIGGSEILTYRRLMEIYAEEAGLAKRWVVTVPVLTPRLSSYWIHLVTPVPAAIARPLAEGLKNPVVCRDNAIQSLIPIGLLTPRESIRLALDKQRSGDVVSHWTDACVTGPKVERAQEGDPDWAGGTHLSDRRKIRVDASPNDLWSVIVKIGGATGWYHADWLWKLRGWLDRVMGGVGLRRGRRSPEFIQVGDALDFWRVESINVGERIILKAEMKLPGVARLEFRIGPGQSDCELHQTATFEPRGLAGILYWFAIAPLHHYVFQGMIEAIKRRAESQGREHAGS